MEKKNKVRTCGNCAYLEIRDKKTVLLLLLLLSSLRMYE